MSATFYDSGPQSLSMKYEFAMHTLYNRLKKYEKVMPSEGDRDMSTQP